MKAVILAGGFGTRISENCTAIIVRVKRDKTIEE